MFLKISVLVIVFLSCLTTLKCEEVEKGELLYKDYIHNNKDTLQL